MVSYSQLLQINTGFTCDGSLLLSNNTNTGGTCFGDSGGPNFVGNTNVVVGVTSFGLNGTCAGTGGVYRADHIDDLTWLATFGVKPLSLQNHLRIPHETMGDFHSSF
jgi:secreted trypsin-like serine protease